MDSCLRRNDGGGATVSIFVAMTGVLRYARCVMCCVVHTGRIDEWVRHTGCSQENTGSRLLLCASISGIMAL